MSTTNSRKVSRKPEMDEKLYRVEVFLDSDGNFVTSFAKGKRTEEEGELIEKHYTLSCKKAEELADLIRMKYKFFSMTLKESGDYRSEHFFSPLIEETVITSYEILGDSKIPIVSGLFPEKPLNHRKRWSGEDKSVVKSTFEGVSYDLEAYYSKIKALEVQLNRTFSSIHTQAYLMKLFTKEQSYELNERSWYI